MIYLFEIINMESLKMEDTINGRSRSSIEAGMTVDIIQKQDQGNGKKTRGVVKEILTNSNTHPYGMKVRLADGKVGRVCEIIII